MSGIAGIFNLNGQPVEQELLSRMVDRLAYRGPDAQNIWSNNCVGLCHALLRTTPESEQESQPCSLDGQISIVGDVRIDNRVELSHKLEAKGFQNLRSASDIALIGYAYQVWGQSCTQHLLGDFAFAVWDGNARKLFCVRDPVGIKQFYYFIDQHKFVFSTDISVILIALAKRPPFNEPLLMDFLSDQYNRWYTETAYKNIVKLKPSCFLEVGDKIVQSSYYDFSSPPALKYKSEADYIEHFRDVFTNAVICRIRSNTSLGLEVSGGVDSSSIASLIKHLESTEEVKLNRPTLYSCVSKRFPKADERSYLNDLLAKCTPWPAQLLNGDQMWALKDYDQDEGFPSDEPEASLMRRPDLDLMRQVNTDGIRTLIGGYGGDQVMLGDAYYMTALIAQLPFRYMVSEWSHFAAERNLNHSRLLFNGFIRPHLSRILPENIRVFLYMHQSTRVIKRS